MRMILDLRTSTITPEIAVLHVVLRGITGRDVTDADHLINALNFPFTRASPTCI